MFLISLHFLEKNKTKKKKQDFFVLFYLQSYLYLWGKYLLDIDQEIYKVSNDNSRLSLYTEILAMKLDYTHQSDKVALKSDELRNAF